MDHIHQQLELSQKVCLTVFKQVLTLRNSMELYKQSYHMKGFMLKQWHNYLEFQICIELHLLLNQQILFLKPGHQ